MRADTAPDVLMDVLSCYKVQEQCDAIRDALDDERRQAQRRMIAALYWRAGATMVLAERAYEAGNEPKAERLINAGAGTWNAARAMEAAL